MRPEIVRLLQLDDDLHDYPAVREALASLPPPRSPDILLEKLRPLGVGPASVVLDIGCGDGEHAARIASAFGCAVVAVDLSLRSVRAAHRTASGAGDARVRVVRALAEALPLRDASADVAWCRDMLYYSPLPRVFDECARVLRSDGHTIVYQSFATELLEPLEARRLYEPFAIVAENMRAEHFERCAHDGGFDIVERDAIGGEWREWWEAEGSRKTSANLTAASRLVRGEARIRSAAGDDAYAFALADQLWGIYQMIGKLRPTAYVLRRR